MRYYTLLILLFVYLSSTAQTEWEQKNTWGGDEKKITPWAKNVSRPNKITKGLSGRHIALWQSHGRYYDNDKGVWKWQRINLFGTTEDLFTQTIVVPYLIPMLENSGAYVFTPRERDFQRNEIIVDNDISWPGGFIVDDDEHGKRHTVEGFGYHAGEYADGENPFTAGTALVMKTTKPKHATTLTYLPEIKEAGRYAVYVSYPKLEDAVDDVRYIVRHKGMQTEFLVNQKIGYGTWVYLGTFDFGVSGINDFSQSNCVILSTASTHKGHIGADAVRFGGGMGNIKRAGITSGMARCLEGARYYAQWAGAPYSVYSDKMGVNDYADDINARSLMTNWLGGGSPYMPTVEGRGVPFEMTLAVHSDAGYNTDGKSVHGSLAIATTFINEGLFLNGEPRQTSLDLASHCLNNLTIDMTREFGTWNKRYLWDRNYSETRLPEIPSAIIETLSHQSFPDMKIGQHPYGKFAIARSLYKTILKYLNGRHSQPFIVQPLAPQDFRIELIDNSRIKLQWTGVSDKYESTSTPTSYNIYTAIGDRGFDNGQNIKSNVVTMKLKHGIQYNFKVTACNDGGESFPTEVLSVYLSPESKGTILVVNGFQRLSAPYIIDDETSQGFDLSKDAGVQYGIYPGWSGRQHNFNVSRMGIEDESGLGYSGEEMAGKFIAGNEFNYVVDHTNAIASARKYSVVSCSLSALEKRQVNLSPYKLVDLAFGLQKDDGQLNLHFKTFTTSTMSQLEEFTAKGGAVLASGSYIGSDMQSTTEKKFLADVLGISFQSTDRVLANGRIAGLGMQYEFYNMLNDKHYAATHPEILSPTGGGICAMQYADGTSAAVGYKGRHNSFTMGFPFECIRNTSHKKKIMQGLLAYLLE